MTTPTNAAFLKLSKRAETSSRQTLIQTFVDVGPLFTLLSSLDHQILFGRRGTGKTHALTFLAESRETAGDAVVLVDLRNMGSNGGLYGDESRPLQERATGLLVDVLTEIHAALYHYFLTHDAQFDLSEAGPALDTLAEAITEVRVVGDVEQQISGATRTTTSDKDGASVGVGPKGPSLGVSSNSDRTDSREMSRVEHRRGVERLYVNFGRTGAAFRRLVGLLG